MLSIPFLSRYCSHFLFVERARRESVRFLLVHFGYIPGGYARPAAGAEQGPVILRKIDGSLDNPVVIHLYKIALADFLIACDQAFAIRTTDFQDMSAPDFPAIRISEDFHKPYASILPFALSK